jgi:large subunit ribosomal protein L19
MQNAILDKIDKMKMRESVPQVEPGDTVRAHVRIREGEKERIQIFEGTVIAQNNTGLRETVTLRKISFGSVAVERIFPIHSPIVAEFEIVRRTRVRRAKLYYLRNLRGKAARLRERDRR